LFILSFIRLRADRFVRLFRNDRSVISVFKISSLERDLMPPIFLRYGVMFLKFCMLR